ncbi:DNA-binding response regulator [Burkholderia stabilis]|uniref:Capsular synthesis regulator component B,transcriptional regulator RcsB,Response regulator,nitrogen regulation protein NR(I),Bacterial regulatory proteins, luxR family n=1 Tax=Burkholderia stabilis TaxID=95485 RepID=A0AAJ5NHE2_9BURK|nr:response regulator transcription factor [Burkholderia stabilis]AOR71525.1 DNA-binding response regulator [Burkholderia stabilis]VBB15699.1 Capsular synthesis regulator component B,transcriptional regulator RcsB,Response regulator,nitrogen regulation protein NR(I),Bacterial regulatory proteins, luxR family [Burkholderia stabilis]HDR9490387.1 response regulator transcription factor [Burkholderia stabilis]HDR9521474.1 response regulator transcription factor [Burkholderia stabilis]HDR9531988.1 
MSEFFVRVMVADDHPSSALGMSQALGGSSTIKLLGTVSNSTDLVAMLDEHPSDVLVVDYVMPGGKYGDGLTLLSFLQRRYPALHLVTITMIDNPSVLRAIQKQGVGCILSKSDAISHLVGAVHAAYVGASYLSPFVKQLLESSEPSPRTNTLTAREIEVVRLYGTGFTVGEIATQLHRSKQTISSQKSSAMKKLGIVRDADLIRYASENKLPDGSESDV